MTTLGQIMLLVAGLGMITLAFYAVVRSAVRDGTRQSRER